MRSARRFLFALSLAAGAARAQSPAAGREAAPKPENQQPQDDKALEKELEQALQKDAAAKAKNAPRSAAPSGAVAPSAPAAAGSGTPQTALSRAFQSLNP